MSYLKTYLPYLFGNKKNYSYKLPQSIEWGSLSFEEALLFHTLNNSLSAYLLGLDLSVLSKKQILQLFNFIDFFPMAFKDKLIKKFEQDFYSYLNSLKSNSLGHRELQKILNFKNNQLTVFALMNPDRKQAGKLLIRMKDGSFFRDKKNNIWSIRTLGLSSRGLNFCHTNGSTPTGIYQINSVMPECNHQYEFGKNRRLKIHFIDDSQLLEYLPKDPQKSFKEHRWWQQASIANTLGRSLFRIHGSGRVNKNPLSSFFPLVPSSGCLTTTERNFLGIWKIDDQRQLLDALMEASHLGKSFTNELKIHGLLYVINFDGTYQALEF